MSKVELGAGSLGFVSVIEGKKDGLVPVVSGSECTDTGCDSSCDDVDIDCQCIAIARSPKTEVIFTSGQK